MTVDLGKTALLLALAEATSYAESPIISDTIKQARVLVVECQRLYDENNTIRSWNDSMRKTLQDAGVHWPPIESFQDWPPGDFDPIKGR